MKIYVFHIVPDKCDVIKARDSKRYCLTAQASTHLIQLLFSARKPPDCCSSLAVFWLLHELFRDARASEHPYPRHCSFLYSSHSFRSGQVRPALF